MVPKTDSSSTTVILVQPIPKLPIDAASCTYTRSEGFKCFYEDLMTLGGVISSWVSNTQSQKRLVTPKPFS